MLNGLKRKIQNCMIERCVKEYEADLKAQQQANVDTLKNYALKEMLSKEGVLDPDYLIYKAGGLEKFKPGFTFVLAGGTDAIYNDHVDLITHTDKGRPLRITPNVVIKESTYTLGITGEYRKILHSATRLRETLLRAGFDPDAVIQKHLQKEHPHRGKHPALPPPRGEGGNFAGYRPRRVSQDRNGSCEAHHPRRFAHRKGGGSPRYPLQGQERGQGGPHRRRVTENTKETAL